MRRWSGGRPSPARAPARASSSSALPTNIRGIRAVRAVRAARIAAAILPAEGDRG